MVKAPRPPPVQQIVLEKKYPEPHLLLAQKWTELNNIDGYWMSEKFDGVRACYNPKIGFLSRSGQLFPAPKWFSKEYPTELQLDGEFFLGRNRFASTIACCKDVENPLWSQMTFQVFDSPFLQLPFEGRLKALNDYFGQNTKTTAHVVEHHTCTGKEMVYSELKRYEKMGAEGLMLRKPKSFYVGKRSATLLKVKSFFDAEARVDEHIGGKGKYAGMMGALQCVMENGLSFKVGTGFSDKHRLQPPAIGTIITYRFQELTPDGVPRFPAFVAERLDLTTPHDALIPAVRRVREDDD